MQLLHLILEILGGDGAYLSVLLGSLIGVSSVHSCPICSVRYTCFSDISHISPITGVLFLCQFINYNTLLLGRATFDLRVTIYWISLKTTVSSIKILFDT